MESVLDMFILNLIAGHVETAYELQVVGKISLGSSSPALKRLEASGAIVAKPSPPGKKHRQPYELTPSGRERLKASRANLLYTEPPSDIDSILRILDVCDMKASSASSFRTFVKQAADDRAKKIKVIMLTERDDEPGFDYLARRRDWEVIKLRAEMKFLTQLAESFV